MNSKIEPFAADSAPTLGARKVWWLVGGQWTHKGWLLPPIVGDWRAELKSNAIKPKS